MIITIPRSNDDVYGTHGSMRDEQNQFICNTLEPRWEDNQEDVSCIPPTLASDGTRLLPPYQCTPHDSSEHPHCWAVNNVPGRTNVRIHSGDWLKDTKGCIIVGLIEKADGVYASALAMQKLHDIVPAEGFELEIIAFSG